MQYTVFGAWQDGTPAVVGVVPGHHEVYGGDEDTFPDGLWFTHITAADITRPMPARINPGPHQRPRAAVGAHHH